MTTPLKDRIPLSHCKNAFSCVTETDLASVCEEIRIGAKTKYDILMMRIMAKNGQINERKSIKRMLPAFTGGLYSDYDERDTQRKHNRNEAYYLSSRVIILDIDHIADVNVLPERGNAIEIENTKDDICNMEEEWLYSNCYAVFASPSGDGIKLIFTVDEPITSKKHYKQCWRYISDRYEEAFPEHAVDKSTNDQTRLCFYSYDPEIRILGNVINLNGLTAHLSNYDAVDPEIETDNGEKVTAGIRTDSQRTLLLLLAEKIIAPRYKQFRDLCSAASNLGRDFLEEFFDVLYHANMHRFSEESRKALQNKAGYIESFMRSHDRVPLQYLISKLTRQDKYTPEMFRSITEKLSVPIKSKANKPLLDYRKIEDNIVNYMNKRYASFKMGAFVIEIPQQDQKQYYDIARSEPTASASSNSIVIGKRNDFKNDMMNRSLIYLDTRGEFCSKGYFDIWWNSKKRRECKNIVCAPGRTTSANEINTWTGFNVDEEKVKAVAEREARDGKLVCQTVLDYFLDTICKNDGQKYKFLMAWLAEMIQNPTAMNKPGVAIVLRSVEKGTGKGTFSAIVQDLVGPIHSVQVNDAETITGKFNYMVESKLFLALDEAVFSGDKKSAQKLKSIISESTVVVERKGIDSYPTDCSARILIMSNASHTLHVEFDNRRIFVFTISPDHRGNIQYFQDIRNCMARDGKESLFNLLRTHVFDRRDLQVRNYQNDDTVEQERQSLNSFELWLMSLMQRQWIFDEIGNRIKLNAETGTYLTFPDMYNDYMMYVDKKKDRYRDNENEFWSYMNSILPLKADRQTQTVHKSIVTEFEIPGLNYIAKMHRGRYAPPGWKDLHDAVWNDDIEPVDYNL